MKVPLTAIEDIIDASGAAAMIEGLLPAAVGRDLPVDRPAATGDLRAGVPHGDRYPDLPSGTARPALARKKYRFAAPPIGVHAGDEPPSQGN